MADWRSLSCPEPIVPDLATGHVLQARSGDAQASLTHAMRRPEYRGPPAIHVDVDSSDVLLLETQTQS